MCPGVKTISDFVQAGNCPTRLADPGEVMAGSKGFSRRIQDGRLCGQSAMVPVTVSAFDLFFKCIICFGGQTKIAITYARFLSKRFHFQDFQSNYVLLKIPLSAWSLFFLFKNFNFLNVYVNRPLLSIKLFNYVLN